jgi:hypothetical protein
LQLNLNDIQGECSGYASGELARRSSKPGSKLNGRLLDAIFKPQQQKNRKKYTEEKTIFTQYSPTIKAIHVNFTI